MPLHRNVERWLAGYLVWSWVGAAYIGCLSPIWRDGFSLSSIGGAICMGILVTYCLTRIRPDLQWLADRFAAFFIRIITKLTK